MSTGTERVVAGHVEHDDESQGVAPSSASQFTRYLVRESEMTSRDPAKMSERNVDTIVKWSATIVGTLMLFPAFFWIVTGTLAILVGAFRTAREFFVIAYGAAVMVAAVTLLRVGRGSIRWSLWKETLGRETDRGGKSGEKRGY